MSYNTPVRVLQGGSVLEIASGGTVSVLAGGSLVNAGASSQSGSVTFSGSVSVTGVIAAPAITIGGTTGRWAFGTVGLASGVGTVATGLANIVSAGGWSVSGVQGGLGSMSSVVVDNSLFSSGSIIFRGLAGSLAFTGSNGTVNWFAIG